MRLLLLALALVFCLSTQADTLTNPGGQGPTGTTCALVAIPAVSTQQTLLQPSAYITIVNTSATTTLYFSPTNPATTSKFPILPNTAYSYGGVPLSNFYVLGSAASGNYGVIAH